MKALKIGNNKKNIRYAIVEDAGAFSIYVERANYASHVKGGIAYTWRYVERGLTLEQAEQLYTKRIAGKR